jgi:surface protein
MKSLNQYIIEKLKVSKKQYNYCPKTREELDDLLDQLLEERGWEADLNDIDTSNITDMEGLFSKHRKVIDEFKYNKNYNFSEFNGDISGWNVSNVTDMRGMFCGCEKFESKGLENWDVSNVTDMRWMFQRCENFEGKELENWDVLNVTKMNGMFLLCKKLNCILTLIKR